MTNTNEIVERPEQEWRREWIESGDADNVDFRDFKIAKLITTLREQVDLIEQQAKKLERKELIILALKARVANWDEMKARIAELEAEVKSLKPDADMYRFYYS